MGEIISGSISTGMFVDISGIGINKKVKIEAIYFCLHIGKGIAWEDVGLALSGLTENEKENLKLSVPLMISIVISND